MKPGRWFQCFDEHKEHSQKWMDRWMDQWEDG